MTFKQAQSIGAQVRKGEKSTTIIHYKFEEMRKEKQSDGSEAQVKVKFSPPRAFPAKVFNATQMEGLEPYITPEIIWDPNERAEALLTASGAVITHDVGDRAYYSPVNDDIHLPDRSAFPDASKYYATALHELGHWTGHSSRLNRDLSGCFGSESYAKEELRAEIASMLIASETGVSNQPHNSAAYVKSWVKVLKDDPNEISRAVRDAELITRYVMDFEKTLEKVKALENDQEKTEETLFTIAHGTKCFLHSVGGYHLAVAYQDEHNLGVAWRDLHKGIFLTGKDDMSRHDVIEDTANWLSPVTKNTLLHGMGENTKVIIETTLKTTPANQSLFVLGDDDTKQLLSEHYPRVHVMTPGDISYGAKYFREAVKDKGIEHSRRVIEQARYGCQHRWERIVGVDHGRKKMETPMKQNSLARD